MDNKQLKLLTISGMIAIISGTFVLNKSFANNQVSPAIAIQTKTVISQAASANLPPQSVVTGWLGFATRANNKGAFLPLIPVNSQAQVAIFSDVWSKVKPGTPLVGVGSGIKQEVKFRRSAEELYGCDNNKTTMATFTAAKRFPEGPVWILPANAAKEAKSLALQPLNLSQVPVSVLPANKRKTSEARAWRAGTATIVMQKQSKDQVRLTILNNSQVAFNTVAKKSFMQGGDPGPVKFPKIDGTPGIPFPIAAFQANAKSAPIVVFWQPGYEGNGYSIVASVKGKTQKIDFDSIYFCAF